MNEEKTLKEELKKNKNAIIAFVAGGIVGSILANINLKVAQSRRRELKDTVLEIVTF